VINSIWLVIGIIVIFVIAIFSILQAISNRTYKPSREIIAKRIKDTIEQTIEYHDFDTFYSVKIAYDPKLEEIRLKYADIIDDPDFQSDIKETDCIAPINESGKKQLEVLMEELRVLPDNV
jgi:hypothetical protein